MLIVVDRGVKLNFHSPQPDAPQTLGPSQPVQPAEAESFVNALRRGDRLCIVLRANYQGWQCWIQDATIRVYYED